MAKWNENPSWTPFEQINGGNRFESKLSAEDLNILAENIAYLKILERSLLGDWTIDQNKLDDVMNRVPEQLLDFKFGIDNPTAGFTSYTGIKSRTEINSTGTYYGAYILQFRDTSGNYIDVYSMEVGSSGNWVGSFYKGNFRFETKQPVSKAFYNWFTSFATLSSGTSDTNTTTLTVTPNETIQTFNASDEGYVGYSQVTVNAIPEGYIQPSGTLTISENGTHDVTNYASAVISIDSYKGEWTASTNYIPDDIVTYQGNVYRCLHTHSGTTPGSDGGMVWEQLNTESGGSSGGGSGEGGGGGLSRVTLPAGSYTLSKQYPDDYANYPSEYEFSERVSGVYPAPHPSASDLSFDKITILGNNGSVEAPNVTINLYLNDTQQTSLSYYDSPVITINANTSVSSYFYNLFMALI